MTLEFGVLRRAPTTVGDAELVNAATCVYIVFVFRKGGNNAPDVCNRPGLHSRQNLLQLGNLS